MKERRKVVVCGGVGGGGGRGRPRWSCTKWVVGWLGGVVVVVVVVSVVSARGVCACVCVRGCVWRLRKLVQTLHTTKAAV